MIRHRTNDPNGTTLGIMGRNARESAIQWNFHEWCRRLAAKAGHRGNWQGQLEELYKGILDRWRYVMEPGEVVAGSPRALLGNVLGLSYQRPGQDPTRARIPVGPARRGTHGFGDCDDVSELVAAGALAMGMTPYFRVARGSVTHVSCLVKMPDGNTISVDPVGHPQYPFGWALPAQKVEVYDLGGQPTLVSAAKGLSGVQDYSILPPTLFSGVDTGYRPTRQTHIGHWCATPRSDAAGPRVIAMPNRFHRLFMDGIVVDGAPGVDDFGNALRYDALRDLWIDDRLAKAQAGAMGAGFLKRMGRRWKKRIAGVRKIVQRIAAPIRALTAKLMTSKLAQNAVGAALMAVGIPRAATKAVLQMSGEILKKGGLPGLIRMIRKNPKAAMQMVAQAAKAGLKRATQVFSGIEQVGQHVIRQSGGQCTGHPVMALVGVPYIGDFGELDLSEAPAPGKWYRIKKGDTLLTVAQRAYGVPTGERLKRAHWINDAAANKPFVDPGAKDNLFKKGKISFSPKWASDPEKAAHGERGSSYAVIWLPVTLGDEPSEKVPADLIPPDTDVDDPDDTPVVTPADSTKPKPGSYYQVKKGDTLLGVAGAAFGLKSGSTRLDRARWINDAVTNRPFVKKSLADSMFPNGRISFSTPYPLIWIPSAKGEEPVKKDEGDLPPEDPKPPKIPTDPPKKDPKIPDRPKNEEDDKLKKFKAACERTPNGHFVVTSSGPGCMVCHPEKGEQWNPVSQRCEVKTTPKIDPLAQEKAACAAKGGTWNLATNACITKPADLSPQEQCEAQGKVWDGSANGGKGACMTRPPQHDPKKECELANGVWDPISKMCVVRPPKDDPIEPPKKESNMMPLLLGAAALLFLGNK